MKNKNSGTFKRIIAVFLALVISATCVVSAFAADSLISEDTAANSIELAKQMEIRKN